MMEIMSGLLVSSGGNDVMWEAVFLESRWRWSGSYEAAERVLGVMMEGSLVQQVVFVT
jgi:hypothetical protein